MKGNGKGDKDNTWTLKRFHMGLRHQRTFHISDVQGQMVDAVISMRGKGPIPYSCFSQIQRPDMLTVTMSDPEGLLLLIITSDGVIIQTNLHESNPIPLDQIAEIFMTVMGTIVPMTDAKDKVNRIGVVHEYELDGLDNSAKTLLSDYVKFDITGVADSVFIRFALKNPSESAIMKLGKKGDYKTILFTLSSARVKEDIEETDKEEQEEPDANQNPPSIITASIDYQLYYVPQVSLRSINIKGLISDSDAYIKRLKETGIILKQ